MYFLPKNNKFQAPSTSDEWHAVSNGFDRKWNFPKCCGALDGKHIRIQCPPCSNSNYFNYKGYFSTILFALVDANYKFMYVDIGKNGRVNDASIFRNCSLKKGIENGTIGFPRGSILVGDDAFPLSAYLLKPYSHHGLLTAAEIIFNYRLSRARRVVENAFGILVSRFRIFTRPIDLIPEKVDEIVKAACSLHNWLRETSPTTYFPFGCVDHEDLETGETIPGTWRNEISELESMQPSSSRNYTKNAASIRNAYKKYFMGPGAVEWQWKQLNRKK
ncbi:uncharacterized protein LOC134287130 [Aedes albopictus]|uniref:DDE Tnp4 domain-containing protein n=1 Tax=Aedes albopictus TaxID=7160 RepID=A0ABM1Y9S9_AEDAL|nr:protein ALP1-like isoform X1 [Aedes albopictus]XP_029730980.1 protein ALP1-like isoform X2 [Aedes albopictus]